MPNRFAAFLPILLLTSCSAILEPIAEAVTDELFIDYPILSEPLDSVWLRSSSFAYQAEHPENYWKSPKEFEADNGGDCEDFAAWMLYHLGPSARCLTILRNGETLNHRIVEYNGAYLEPQTYGKTYLPSDFTLVVSLSYDATMKLSTNLFTK